MTTTVRSAIARADSAAYDAQQEVEKSVAEIEAALDRLAYATTDLRAAHDRLQKMQQLAATHGLQHEIPYERER